MTINYDVATLGDIVCNLDGATQIFRKYGLDFCCGGRMLLVDAAASAQIPLSNIIHDLKMLKRNNTRPPNDPCELASYIVEKYHITHRQDLIEIGLLLDRASVAHSEHGLWPQQLKPAVVQLTADMLQHMTAEENVLFPIIPIISEVVNLPQNKNYKEYDKKEYAAILDHLTNEHTAYGEQLRKISQITNNYTPPKDACNTWVALYKLLRKLHEDIEDHVHLENNILWIMIEKWLKND